MVVFFTTMKKLFFVFTIFLGLTVNAQVTDAEDDLKKAASLDTVSKWEKGALFNLGFSQVSLFNWAAGGNNSISGNGVANFHLNHVSEKSSWENTLNLGYGLLKQDENDVQKTDDNIEFTSKYGRKASNKWYYAGLLNFKTQFAPGYNFPNDSVKISNFLAPGYLLGAIGMNYKHKKILGLFISPVTSKTTFVFDDTLSAAGAFGVEENKNIRTEVGGYVRANFQKEVMENVRLATTLGLFSNYLEKPQNIDVNFDLMVLMKVNKFITVSLNTNLIYDDDITITNDKDGDGDFEVNGPRVQFKQILTVGFSYKL